MKTKASITLSSEVLERIDQSIGEASSRSAFIERVLREYFRDEARRRIQTRDIERINAAVDLLNEEALDTLEYQALD